VVIEGPPSNVLKLEQVFKSPLNFTPFRIKSIFSCLNEFRVILLTEDLRDIRQLAYSTLNNLLYLESELFDLKLIESLFFGLVGVEGVLNL
jgi:hypothetical protein